MTANGNRRSRTRFCVHLLRLSSAANTLHLLHPRANNILTTAASRAATLLALSLAQEGMLMSTYEEFMIIIAVAGLIVSILNLTHKK